MANTELPVPQGVVAGKYRLTRLLGRGGMGAVWEGTHISLGTRVAVKFIDAEYAQSAEARSRFENEARAAAKLRSKHVVEVYDHGVGDDSRPFIVMEFLQGEPLDKRLDRLGRLPAKDTAQIVLQICRALTKAHAANIVHRDLKPENVFLVWDEEEGTDVVKVVDFGIAKFSDAAAGSSSATRTGSVLGTPHYMSPEQARGLRSVDYRSDLWSVAVIAYRCIVGSLPFEGEAVGDLLVKLCTAPIPVPSRFTPNLPPGFDAWIAKGLSREPRERFASAVELAESLAAICGLSVRGQYVSAEMQRTPELGTQPQGAFGSGPHGAFQSGSQPGIVQTGSGSFANSRGAGLATGAPTTQTPPPVKRTGPGALIAAGVAAVVVLGIGAAVAAKVFLGSGGNAPSSAAAPLATAITSVVPTVVPRAPVPAAEPAVPPEPVAPAVSASAPAASDAARAAIPPARPAPAARPAAAARPAQNPPQRPSAPAAGSDIGF